MGWLFTKKHETMEEQEAKYRRCYICGKIPGHGIGFGYDPDIEYYTGFCEECRQYICLDKHFVERKDPWSGSPISNTLGYCTRCAKGKDDAFDLEVWGAERGIT